MPERNAEPTEAYAMGTLHGVLKEAGLELQYPIDVNTRAFDVIGLVPPMTINGTTTSPIIRITIEEVQ